MRPTGDWRILAREAVARLRVADTATPRTPEDPEPRLAWDTGHGVDPEDPAPAASFDRPGTMAALRRAAAAADPPMHLPDGVAEAVAAQGRDPAATDAEGRERPDRPLPHDLLLLVLRMAVTFGSRAGRDAALAPGAVTLVEAGRDAERAVRVLDACLPRGHRVRLRLDRDSGASLRVILFPDRGAGEVRTRQAEADLLHALGLPKPVLCLVSRAGDLPDRVAASLPPAHRLAPLSAEIVIEHLRASHSATGAVGDGPLRAILPGDGDLVALDPLVVARAFRAPTPGGVAWALAGAAAPRPMDGPTLADIEGWGAAEDVARRMVADLRRWREGRLDWSEAARSVVFHGPPGTGKSHLARAMAGEAGVALVRGSFAAWQARGHLGDMLAAMAKTFAEARDRAPAILVLDELDAVGDRASGAGRNARYDRKVVTATLEHMDRIAETAGVLVVATTNDIDAIDAALLRPGRIDARVAVPPPARAAIAAMLRRALPDIALSDLPCLVHAGIGRTPAEIDAALRAGRGRARAAGRAVTAGDIAAALGGEADTPALLRRGAIHAAGHAVVAHALVLGGIERVALAPGGCEVRLERAPHEGRLADHRAEIVYHLAGRAAEIAVLGDASSAAGGDANSDLARATRLAGEIEARFGLGSGLSWSETPPPDAAPRIRAHLARAHDIALRILDARRVEVDILARALVRHGEVTGDEVAKIFGEGGNALVS